MPHEARWCARGCFEALAAFGSGWRRTCGSARAERVWRMRGPLRDPCAGLWCTQIGEQATWPISVHIVTWTGVKRDMGANSDLHTCRARVNEHVCQKPLRIGHVGSTPTLSIRDGHRRRQSRPLDFRAEGQLSDLCFQSFLVGFCTTAPPLTGALGPHRLSRTVLRSVAHKSIDRPHARHHHTRTVPAHSARVGDGIIRTLTYMFDIISGLEGLDEDSGWLGA